MFSTPHAAGSSLHLGDLVVDMFNATKCGVIVGPGNQGVKVSWWSELDSQKRLHLSEPQQACSQYDDQ